ncbi:MAG: hypothetical protein OXM59_02275 [Gammaproteobacteria bacterium]|nr:hypothetical protein [Gammaproteobacteria bacterium]
MPPDFLVSMAGGLILAAALGYWYARSGDSGRGLHRRFREYAQQLPRRSEKAVSAYLAQAEEESSEPGAAFELAAYFRSGGDWRRALQIHESLAAREDLDPATRAHAGLEIGDDYRAAGMLDRAEEAYVRTAEYLPLRLNALERQLGVCEQLSDWERAVGVAEQVRSEDSSLGSRLRCHYLCELAAQAAGAGDMRRARSYWRKAARGADESARLVVDPAILDPHDPRRSLARAAHNPEAAVLILLGLAGRPGFTRTEIGEMLEGLVVEHPALAPAVGCALPMEPELLCPASARCLFASLQERLPAFAGTYGAGEPAEFSKESLGALIAELVTASGGPPRWRCTICGHQDETHRWRCNECGAWESARLISVLAP